MNILEIENKIEKSGIGCNPIVTNKELEYYTSELRDMVDYFYGLGENIIASGLRYKLTSAESILFHRNFRWDNKF